MTLIKTTFILQINLAFFFFFGGFRNYVLAICDITDFLSNVGIHNKW